MKKSRKELIKSLHSTVSVDLRQSIAKEFPKLFKEDYLVGKWYKREGDGNLWFCTRVYQECAYGYGFAMDGSWADLSLGYNYDLPYSLATESEVYWGLIAECEKRSLKPENHLCLRDNKLWEDNIGGQYDFFIDKDLLMIGASVVYLDGVWAKTIEVITLEQAEKELGKKILN
tara:strand:- start:30 stop:548 length:519 start_codon:yes stop_codon:yes gene_type:complete